VLARPEVDYIQVRDTRAGCYDPRIERATVEEERLAASMAFTIVCPWNFPFSMKIRLVNRPETTAPAMYTPFTLVCSVSGS